MQRAISVILSEDEMRKLRVLAAQKEMNLSEWIRQAIRDGKVKPMDENGMVKSA